MLSGHMELQINMVSSNNYSTGTTLNPAAFLHARWALCSMFSLGCQGSFEIKQCQKRPQALRK